MAVQEDGYLRSMVLRCWGSNEAELTSMLQQEAGGNRDMLFVIAADATPPINRGGVMDIAVNWDFWTLISVRSCHLVSRYQ